MTPPPSGGPLSSYTLQVDLDSGKTHFLDASMPSESKVFEQFSISEGDPLSFNVYATAERGSYRWQIDLEVREAGKRAKIISLPSRHEGISRYTTIGLRCAEGLPRYGRRSERFFPAEEWADNLPS